MRDENGAETAAVFLFIVVTTTHPHVVWPVDCREHTTMARRFFCHVTFVLLTSGPDARTGAAVLLKDRINGRLQVI